MGRYDLGLSEAEFWAMTPYEFSLLLERHRIDGKWREMMAAVQPMLFAEAHRDEKKRSTSFSLEEMTLTGLSKAAQRVEEAQDESISMTPARIWEKVGGVMRACGG